MASPDGSPLCKRCKSCPGFFNVRSEKLCQNCFQAYLHSKLLRRMDLFRIYSPTTENSLLSCSNSHSPLLLLPISLGISSTTLLYMLDWLYQRQVTRMRGITSFKLTVLHIDFTSINAKFYNSSPCCSFDDLHTHYASSPYQFHILSIDHQWKSVLSEILQNPSSHQSILSPSSHHNLDTLTLNNFLECLPSKSCQSDVLEYLQNRLILLKARQLSCHSVFWGHSMTRLAELSLSELTKGRAHFIPSLLASPDHNHPSSHSQDKLTSKFLFGIYTLYPFRDILRSELLDYATHIISNSHFSLENLTLHCDSPNPSTTTLLTTPGKSTSVNCLVNNFFTSLHSDYPAMISNVVRTMEKLTLLPIPKGMSAPTPIPVPQSNSSCFQFSSLACPLCLMPNVHESEFFSTLESSTNQFSESLFNICRSCCQIIPEQLLRQLAKLP